MRFLIDERFLVENRRLARPGELPGGDVGEIRVVPPGFAIRGLEFDAEMAAARFAAVQGVPAKDLGEFEEIGDAAGVFQVLVQLLVAAGDFDVFPKLLAQEGDLPQGLLQPLFIARHAAFFPHQCPQLLVE